MSNLNTVISRVYVHHRKKLMDEGQRKFGFPFNLSDLLSHTIHLCRLCKLCVFTHTCTRKKGTPHPLCPHSLATDSSATLHLINFYLGGHPKLDGYYRRAEVGAPNGTGFRPYRFPPPICTDILDSSRLGFSAGLGWGFFSWRR